jgi:HAE1 family hydrophobic/amphiphilic exporter-1
MKIYEASVKKPVTTILIFVGIVVMGLFSLTNLPVDLLPDIESNTIMVMTSYQGASAEDIEQNITRPLEGSLNTVSDLKKLTSVSQNNSSIITLEFNWGTPIDEATNDVRDKLDLIKSYLPDDAEDPVIFKFSMDMIPVVILSAEARESMSGLYQILDDKVANPLNRINGVGSVSISGAPRREVSVNMDPRKMEAYGISVEQLGTLIAQENRNTPAGAFDVGSETYALRVEGEFSDSRQLNDLVVSVHQGRPVYLKDIAIVRDTLEERSQDFYINGERGAGLIVQKQSGANTVEIARKVRDALPEIQKNLPPDVQLGVIMDTSENIVNSINSLTETVVLAAVFVVFVVLFFLGRWRPTLIVILTIPISLVASFIYLMVAGTSINIISLSALSIAIGMVVDDAIVVLENITTHIDRGSKPREAAIYGTNEVAVAVMAATLTIIAVFFPLTMITGLAGILFRPLGWMVTIIITMSIICALSLTPMLSAWLMKRENKRSRFFEVVYGPIERMLDRLDNAYEASLSWAVRHRLVVLLSALGLTGASLFLVNQIGTGFFPSSDNGQISASLRLPISARKEVAAQIGERVFHMWKEKYPEIEKITYSVGTAGSDNTYAMMQANGDNIVSFTLRMTPFEERERDIFEISEQMRLDLEAFPELDRFQVDPGGSRGSSMTSGGTTVDVEIFGFDFEETDRIARTLKDKFADIPGFQDLTISREDYRPEYRVEFDREKLALHGLNLNTASQYVRNRINGFTATQYREEGDEYDLIVRYDRKYRESVSDIENILIYTPQGQGIRVRELGKVVERFSPPRIDRQDRERIVKVTGILAGDATLDKVVAAVRERVAQVDIPSDIGITIGGSYEEQQESFADLGLLLALVILLVYIVMAAQFESFAQPFIIMLSLPFAFVGVLISLYITGQPLNMMSLIGSVMLVGIVVKNGIVLIDFINLNRERGDGVIKAVVSGGKSRLRPILMTSLTTILGMIPMALGVGEGASTWQPMGIAIIGGLTVSTVLTLIVIPTAYAFVGGVGVRKERRRLTAEFESLNL